MSKGKKALTIISLIILVLALAFVVYKLFRVREVNVMGCETLDEEYVISLSGIEYDKFIFEIDTQEIQEAIDVDPYIKPISAEIVYPDGIKIKIDERKIAACIEKGDSLLLIDDECFLLEVLPQISTEEYAVVVGLQVDECHVGKSLGVRDSYLLGVLSNVLIETETLDISLCGIDISLAAHIVLETKEGLTIELGDDTALATKFALIKTSVQELEEMGKRSGILDVASGESAYFR